MWVNILINFMYSVKSRGIIKSIISLLVQKKWIKKSKGQVKEKKQAWNKEGKDLLLNDKVVRAKVQDTTICCLQDTHM
jgi:hypothetical protein